jgi:hypothetical protein
MQSDVRSGTAFRFLTENSHLLVVSLAAFLLIYLSSFVKAYGYFIDEFYYIACASNPAFGYVDHPPLAPLILAIVQFLFGSSLLVVRIVPALVASASVLLTGILAREIGGGKFAQIISACAMAASPTVIAFGGFYSMNVFEPLLAVALLYQGVRMVKEENPRRWIASGIIMGLGVMNKHTFVVFAAVYVFSLLVAGKWRFVLTRWTVAGGLCAAVIILPNLFWQVANDFPSLEFYRNITLYKNVYTPPPAFLLGQVMGMSPFTVPIWVGGLFFLLLSQRTKEFRFFGVLFVILFLVIMLSGTSRSDRLAFAYPAAFAGGGLLIEAIAARFRIRWLNVAVPVFLFAGLALSLPVILPYFTYEQVRSHTEWLGLNTELEKGKKPPLPQLLADRIGWEEKVDLVIRAYEGLPDSDRSVAIIAADNYGDAGAIELFTRHRTFPLVACAHNNYFLWSKDRLSGEVVLHLTREENEKRLKERFGSVERAVGKFESPYVSGHENNLTVFVCRKPRTSFAEMLERGKTYF